MTMEGSTCNANNENEAIAVVQQTTPPRRVTSAGHDLLDEHSLTSLDRLAASSTHSIPRAPSTGNSIDSDVSVTTKAIASSSALVGESVVEPSRYHHSHAKRKALLLERQQQQQQTTSTTRRQWISNKVSAGMEWIQRKREERRLALLEQQVEEQRRILHEAQHGPPPDDEEDMNTTPHIMNQSSNVSYSRSGSGIQVDVLGIPTHDHDDDTEDEDYIPQVRLEAEPSTAPPFILTQEQAQQLSEQALPASIAYSRWKRVYCLARDGDSFDAFLGKVQDHSHTLLVIRTTKGAVFGAYAESTWKPRGPAFFGSAQACLFSFASQNLRVYKWTGQNQYIQVCDASKKMVAFGGGGQDGTFGLCIESDFRLGSTGPCDTFGNVPLCGDENFKVVDVEVYGFLLGQF